MAINIYVENNLQQSMSRLRAILMNCLQMTVPSGQGMTVVYGEAVIVSHVLRNTQNAVFLGDSG